MTVQAEPLRGTLAERPPAQNVPIGQVYEDDQGDRWKSDGREWWNANAERDPWRLAYAEDLEQGMEIRNFAEVPPQLAPGGFAVLIQGTPMHIPEWVVIAEIRGDGDMRAMIGVRPNGEQVAIYLGRLQLVQVRSEVPA